MTNEEIIEELLHEAEEIKVRNEVIEMAKNLMDTNSKMDRITAIELSLKHFKNT